MKVITASTIHRQSSQLGGRRREDRSHRLTEVELQGFTQTFQSGHLGFALAGHVDIQALSDVQISLLPNLSAKLLHR